MIIRPDARKRISSLKIALAFGLAPMLLPAILTTPAEAQSGHLLVGEDGEGSCSISIRHRLDVELVDWDQTVVGRISRGRTGRTLFLTREPVPEGLRPSIHYERIDGRRNINFMSCLTNAGAEGVPWFDADFVGVNNTSSDLGRLPKEGGELMMGAQGQDFSGKHLLVEARARNRRSPRSATYTLHFSYGIAPYADEIANSDDIDDLSLAMGDDDTLMTSDPGPTPAPAGTETAQLDWMDDPDAFETDTDHPQMQPLAPTPGTTPGEAPQSGPAMPGMPGVPNPVLLPDLADLLPTSDPEDNSQFMPEGEIETVTDGYLEAPRWVEAGRTFTARWDDRLSRSDRVTIVPAGTPDSELGEGEQNIRVRNRSSSSLRAPDELGSHEVRYFSDEDQSVHARVMVEVADPIIEINVSDEVYSGRDFRVEWGDRLSRSDRVTIVPVGTPDTELGEDQQNIPVRNRSASSLRAPDELGTYEIRYFRSQQERVVGRAFVEVVDPVMEIEVADHIHAGRDFRVEWGDRLSRSDRVTIVPVGTPDTELGEDQQNIPVRNRSASSLRAPDELGTYEIRYFRSQQERVVGRAVAEVVDPDILVLAPMEVEAGTDFTVSWSDRLSRQDRVTIVHADAAEDFLGDGRQNIRVRNRDSGTLRAPDRHGEFEVRYFRDQQERVVGRALVTVRPEGSEVAITEAEGTPSIQELTGIMDRLVELADRLDDVAPDERRAVREELIGYGPHAIDLIVELVDDGRIAPWQAAGFVGGSFDPPPPPPTAGDSIGQATRAGQRQAHFTARQPGTDQPATQQAAAAHDSLSSQDERRIIMLITRLEGVSPDEQQPIIDELAGYGPAATDLLLEMMQDGLIYRPLALRAAAAIEAGGAAPAPQAQTQPSQQLQTQQPAPQPAARQPAGYQVIGVAPDDMLNVRDRAGVSGSTVIGRLAPDARGVVRSGDVQNVGGRDWWHIRHPALPAQGGWVNSRFLSAQAGLAAEELSYRVIGVAMGDALNIRSFPGTDGEIIARASPDAEGLRWNGQSAAVAGATWWELVHPDLPGNTGWVNSRFLEAQEGVAVTSVAPPRLEGLQPPFTEAEGYATIEADPAVNRLIDTLPQTSSIFPPGNELNPLTKAVLILENEEGVAAHARYRIRYGLERRHNSLGGPPVPFSFVQIDRFNLGEVFREAIAESFGEARTPPPEAFGAGAHVSYRFEIRPIQGRVADVVAMSRRVIPNGEAQGMECLTLICLHLGSVGEGSMTWRDDAGRGTGFDRPYEDIRNGVYTPATMMDLLTLGIGVSRISDGRLIWTGFEESESVRPGEPFMEIIMDVNLAQDYGIEAVLRWGNLMDDSVAAIWSRAVTFPGGDAEPHLATERFFECARGEPSAEGLCP